MAYEKRPNTGTLFTNDRKATDSHPDYTGTLDVAGMEFWISGWKKQGQKGEFISISVKPKEAKAPDSYDSRKSKPVRVAPQNNDLEDSIPF